MNISNEKYFFGNFTYNQFKYGILFYIDTNYVYYGEFNEGNFEKGIIFKNEGVKQRKEKKKEALQFIMKLIMELFFLVILLMMNLLKVY